MVLFFLFASWASCSLMNCVWIFAKKKKNDFIFRDKMHGRRNISLFPVRVRVCFLVGISEHARTCACKPENKHAYILILWQVSTNQRQERFIWTDWFWLLSFKSLLKVWFYFFFWLWTKRWSHSLLEIDRMQIFLKVAQPKSTTLGVFCSMQGICYILCKTRSKQSLG